jgi:hypothetical protein
MTHTVYCVFGRGQWYLYFARHKAEIYWNATREILLEVPCRKMPPNTISLHGLLTGYVEREQLPILLAIFQGLDWGNGGLRATAINTITQILETL